MMGEAVLQSWKAHAQACPPCSTAQCPEAALAAGRRSARYVSRQAHGPQGRAPRPPDPWACSTPVPSHAGPHGAGRPQDGVWRGGGRAMKKEGHCVCDEGPARHGSVHRPRILQLPWKGVACMGEARGWSTPQFVHSNLNLNHHIFVHMPSVVSSLA